MEKKKLLAFNEKKRIMALYSYNILDARSDKFLDSMTELSSLICNTPIALVSLIDEKRQWFKSNVGLNIRQTLRKIAFCNQAIKQNELYVVQDSFNHPLFKDNPLVTGEPHIRFYAGMPLTDPDGYNIGTLCVIDHKPKTLSELQKSTLGYLSKSIINYLVLRKSKLELSLVAQDLHSLFLNSPDLICTATPDGYFKKISSAFITELGYTESELLKQPFLNLVHPDDLAETLNALGQLGTKGTSVRLFRNRYRCKNGTYLWLSWNAISHHSSGQIIATARNITEKILMEEKLKKMLEEEKKFDEEKIQQLSMLSSALSHEMLNPLNMVLGFSGVGIELIDEILDKNDVHSANNNLIQVKTDILKIQEHASHMANVVSNMTALNWNSSVSSDTDKTKLNQAFKINRVLAECMRMAFTNFKSKNPDFHCEFEHDFDKKDLKCYLSVNDFSKAIMNCLCNSFESMVHKLNINQDLIPKIIVTTRLVDTTIIIRISDNGTGIKPEIVKKVFNPFFTTKPHGLGLGLSISYNIIKMYHGSISVEKSDNSETVFKISLPAEN